MYHYAQRFIFWKTNFIIKGRWRIFISFIIIILGYNHVIYLTSFINWYNQLGEGEFSKLLLSAY